MGTDGEERTDRLRAATVVPTCSHWHSSPKYSAKAAGNVNCQLIATSVIAQLCLWVSAVTATAVDSDKGLPNNSSQDRNALEWQLDRDAHGNSTTADGTTALLRAVYDDNVKLAALLLEMGADADALNRYKATPLVVACANSNPDMVELLLSAGADANFAPMGEPPLMTGARSGVVASVRHLLAAGADIHAVDGLRGQTPLMWAAAEDHVAVIEVLLEAGAEINATSKGNFTALKFAVRQDAREAVGLLIDAGADVNPVLLETDETQTKGKGAAQDVLNIAVSNRHYTIAAMLLDAGSDPNATNAQGRTVLHDLMASRSPKSHLGNVVVAFNAEDPSQLSSLKLLEMLLAKGADPNPRTEPSPIVHERWTDKNIYSAGHPRMDNAVNLGGVTPYLLAAQGADADAMRVLEAGGADPRLTTYSNTTALMLAAGVGRVEGARQYRPEKDALESVELALAAGVDANAANANGQTALHGAVYSAANSIIEKLVESGARTDLSDELGRTALDLSEQGFNQNGSLIRRDKSAALLRELGAKPTKQHEANRYADHFVASAR